MFPDDPPVSMRSGRTAAATFSLGPKTIMPNLKLKGTDAANPSAR